MILCVRIIIKKMIQVIKITTPLLPPNKHKKTYLNKDTQRKNIVLVGKINKCVLKSDLLDQECALFIFLLHIHIGFISCYIVCFSFMIVCTFLLLRYKPFLKQAHTFTFCLAYYTNNEIYSKVYHHIFHYCFNTT